MNRRFGRYLRRRLPARLQSWFRITQCARDESAHVLPTPLRSTIRITECARDEAAFVLPARLQWWFPITESVRDKAAFVQVVHKLAVGLRMATPAGHAKLIECRR